jgi:hypothetical protein
MNLAISRFRIQNILKFLAIAAVGASISVGWNAYLNSGPSVTVQGITEADGVVTSATGINLIIHATRNRFCPETTARFLWRWTQFNGKKIIEYRPIIGPVSPPTPEPGVEYYMMTLELPPHTEPGEWFYQSVTVYNCSWLPGLETSRIRRSPPVLIRVEQ